MSLFQQYLYNPVCLSCGSFFVKEHLFCEDCFEQKLRPKIEIKSKTINKEAEAHYLLDWIPFESDMISEFVYRMKSDKCSRAWKYFSENMTEQISENQSLIDVDYIIPIPGSKVSSTHSHVFAQMLGRTLRKPILDILVKPPNQSEQKRKNKAERLYKTIQLHEQFTTNLRLLNLPSSHVLIVDDILTTGSSFNQSVAALGPIKKASLLTLFYRTANPNTVLVS